MRMNTGAEQQGEGGAFLMLDFGCWIAAGPLWRVASNR